MGNGGGTSEDTFEKKLVEVGGVYVNTHVVFTSWKHGTGFVNWVEVLADPEVAEMAADRLARSVFDRFGSSFDTIAGPTHTGDKVASHLGLSLAYVAPDLTVKIVYAQEVTQQMKVLVGGEERIFEVTSDRVPERVSAIVGAQSQTLGVVTDRLSFPRGLKKYVEGRKVLVVDDVLTTGGTIRSVIKAVRESGGTPIGVAVGCNRSTLTEDFDGLPLVALLTVSMDQWYEEDCPACAQRIPMETVVGHGKEWLAKNPDPYQWPAYLKAKSRA